MPAEDPSLNSEPSAADSEDAIRRERDEFYERLLRLTAEFDNYRKRTERERREWTEAAGVDVIRDLLPVVDDLERALATPVGEGGVAQFRSGVDLIRRQLLDVLRRRGVEPLDVVGHDFDPQWHESVAQEDAKDARDGEITGEVRRGYRIGQRLLRPAMVKVAKR